MISKILFFDDFSLYCYFYQQTKNLGKYCRIFWILLLKKNYQSETIVNIAAEISYQTFWNINFPSKLSDLKNPTYRLV